jgi:hypothetical protein
MAVKASMAKSLGLVVNFCGVAAVSDAGMVGG